MIASLSGNANSNADIIIAYSHPFIAPGMMPRNLLKPPWFIVSGTRRIMNPATMPSKILATIAVRIKASGNNQTPSEKSLASPRAI